MDEEDDERYDPDYDLGRKSDKQAPEASLHIEEGLRAGQRALSEQLARIPAKTIHRDHGLVNEKLLEEWLLANECIILPTDKNLGCAVVTRT
ncbi:hypothetical protein FRB97_003900, partial [Tulasnella sp. 331]